VPQEPFLCTFKVSILKTVDDPVMHGRGGFHILLHYHILHHGKPQLVVHIGKDLKAPFAPGFLPDIPVEGYVVLRKNRISAFNGRIGLCYIKHFVHHASENSKVARFKLFLLNNRFKNSRFAHESDTYDLNKIVMVEFRNLVSSSRKVFYQALVLKLAKSHTNRSPAYLKFFCNFHLLDMLPRYEPSRP